MKWIAAYLTHYVQIMYKGFLEDEFSVLICIQVLSQYASVKWVMNFLLLELLRRTCDVEMCYLTQRIESGIFSHAGRRLLYIYAVTIDIHATKGKDLKGKSD